MSRRFELTTPTPCMQDWNAMSGNRRERYCGSCAKPVHDLAHMKRSDIDVFAVAVASGEEICARITRRGDGSLVTLDRGQRTGLGAGLMLSAAMMVGQAAAQTPADRTAIVSGRLLSLDGKPFEAVGGRVALRDASGELMIFPLKRNGEFVFTAKPGQYDVMIRGNVMVAQEIKGAMLHAGNQSFGDVKGSVLTSSWDSGEVWITTGGALASSISGWKYHVRHPIAYIRYLGRKLT